MNLVDILVWVVLLIFAVKGFMKGLVREVCSLLGLVVGGWTAFTYCRPLAEVLQSHIPFSHTVTLLLSFGLIFLALGLFFIFLGYLLTALLKIILLGSLNRIGGVLLGVLQGALVLCILLTLGTCASVPVKVRTYIEKSATARPFLVCGRELASWWKIGPHAVNKS
ncbi:MAG: CvpA family protein [Geobacteraceae bacterium]|nr:CvpA family protein [Geobacteraceae bacterium]